MPFISMVKGDSGFDREKFIEHSLMCGVLSKTISLSTGLGDPNEVYIGGMMHDIGSIVTYRYFKDGWEQACSLVREKGMAWHEAETEIFSVDHGYIGAMLLGLWNIPKGITESVMFHHSPGAAEENRSNVMAVHLGNKFSKLIDIHDDFLSFDDFFKRHRSFLDIDGELGLHLSPGDEMIFYETIYAFTKKMRHHAGEAIGEGQ
jgi:HD-like signal output (HDOD) protein